jgi:hypothetical protein
LFLLTLLYFQYFDSINVDEIASEADAEAFLAACNAQEPYQVPIASGTRHVAPLADLTIPVDKKPAPFPTFLFASIALMRSGTFLRVTTGLEVNVESAVYFKLVSVSLKSSAHFVCLYTDGDDLWILDDEKHKK